MRPPSSLKFGFASVDMVSGAALRASGAIPYARDGYTARRIACDVFSGRDRQRLGTGPAGRGNAGPGCRRTDRPLDNDGEHSGGITSFRPRLAQAALWDIAGRY